LRVTPEGSWPADSNTAQPVKTTEKDKDAVLQQQQFHSTQHALLDASHPHKDNISTLVTAAGAFAVHHRVGEVTDL
jgi:hypothetical protein